MKRFRDADTWYWALIALLLGGALSGCPLGLVPVLAVSLAQTLHALLRHGRPRAFAVQVRVSFLMLVLASLWVPLGLMHVMQMLAVLALLAFDYCPLARFLSLMPWNRPRRPGLRDVAEALVAPPSAFRPLVT
jgi:hypothetical protein